MNRDEKKWAIRLTVITVIVTLCTCMPILGDYLDKKYSCENSNMTLTDWKLSSRYVECNNKMCFIEEEKVLDKFKDPVSIKYTVKCD